MISKMNKDMRIIQRLGTFPNSDDGLSADELKAKFDEGGMALQEYINNTLVPAIADLGKMDTRAVWRVAVEKQDGVYSPNRTVTELRTAYNEGKSMVCWLGGRELQLTGVDKDANNLFRYHFSGRSADGNLTHRVTLYPPLDGEGDASTKPLAAVYSDLSLIDLSGYSMLGKVGIIGDSLSVGVEDTGSGTTQQNTDHSWGAYLSRTAGNPCVFLGFSGATSATFINDGYLDAALQEENRCDAYIVGLGFNDCHGNVTLGGMDHITGSDLYPDGKPYGSYYFNMEKILRKLHDFNPDAPIFVLTNPEFGGPDATEMFNEALRQIQSDRGSGYNARLIDLYKTYGPIFENLEAVRGSGNHFDRQTYAYMGQIIGTAITRDIQKNPGAYPQLKGYLPDEADPSLPARFTVRVDTDTIVNRSVDEMTAAYQAGQSLVLYDNGYVAALEGIGRDSNNKYIYTFRCHDQNGAQKVYTVSSPNVLEKSTVEAGGESGGIEKIIDFTTTKTTREFQIPIDTDEMADKLLKASELHIFLYIPRDAADTETTTTGNVSVGVVSQGDYHAEFAKFEGVIVPPTATYMTHSQSLAKIFIDTFEGSAERLAVGMQCKKIANVANANNAYSLYRTLVDTRGFYKNGNFFVTGTQNMAAGTRFVLGVRA